MKGAQQSWELQSCCPDQCIRLNIKTYIRQGVGIMRLFSKHYKKVKYPKNRNNKLIIHTKKGTKVNPRFVKGIKVNFKGENSVLEIFEPEKLSGSMFFLYNGDNFTIKNSQGNIFVVGGHNSILFIDENCTLQNTRFFLNDENGIYIRIGKDCMFSFDTSIWASDTHKICDMNTGDIVNAAKKGIDIGNHVWCGTHCTILKETTVKDNTVIGASSVVKGQFDETNIIIAGNPARKVKSGIIWKRDGIS